MLAVLAATASTPIGVAGCSGPARTPPTKPVDTVTYKTGIGTRPREEYVQVSIAQGYFSQANLQVTVVPGAPSDANIKDVVSGQAQFATIDFVSAIRGASTFKDTNGSPAYRIVAAIQNRTLLAFLALASSNITRPADFEGKTLGVPANSAGQTLFPAYAKLAGFDPARVQFANFAPDDIPRLLVTGRINAMGGYSIDVPTVRKAAAGQGVTMLPFDTYMGDLYGTVLITNTRMITSRPDLVRRFTRALVQGAKYAVTHPDEAGKIITRAVRLTDEPVAAETMNLMRPYVTTGMLQEQRVMQGIALLEQNRLAPQGLQPADIVAFDVLPQGA
jgi:NitT/TauT family transport system substrate-binding protein